MVVAADGRRNFVKAATWMCLGGLDGLHRYLFCCDYYNIK